MVRIGRLGIRMALVMLLAAAAKPILSPLQRNIATSALNTAPIADSGVILCLIVHRIGVLQALRTDATYVLREQ